MNTAVDKQWTINIINNNDDNDDNKRLQNTQFNGHLE